MLHQRNALGKWRVAQASPSNFGLLRCISRRTVVPLDATAAGESTTSKPHHTKMCIIGSGPAAHTAAIYAARAELEPVMLEGFMANGIAPGGQLTTTTFIENFPGQAEPILGIDLMEVMRKQSAQFGTTIFTETVNKVDLSRRPFSVWTDSRQITADTLIIATGAGAKRLHFPGADDLWQKGISACAICDGAAPHVRKHEVAVVGGGDVAMEEALFLAKYASKVHIIHRFNYLEASKVMARRVLAHPNLNIVYEHECVEALADSEGYLDRLRIRSTANPSHTTDLPVTALFFAIGHTPATAFLGNQLVTDARGYIQVKSGSSETSVEGVFAAGDVCDSKYRQAVVAAGSGCMAALDAEWYLQALYHRDLHGSQSDGADQSDAESAPGARSPSLAVI